MVSRPHRPGKSLGPGAAGGRGELCSGEERGAAAAAAAGRPREEDGAPLPGGRVRVPVCLCQAGSQACPRLDLGIASSARGPARYFTGKCPLGSPGVLDCLGVQAGRWVLGPRWRGAGVLSGVAAVLSAYWSLRADRYCTGVRPGFCPMWGTRRPKRHDVLPKSPGERESSPPAPHKQPWWAP